MLDARWSMPIVLLVLDVGYWIFDAGLVLDTRYSMFDAGYSIDSSSSSLSSSMLDAGHSLRDARCSMFRQIGHTVLLSHCPIVQMTNQIPLTILLCIQNIPFLHQLQLVYQKHQNNAYQQGYQR